MLTLKNIPDYHPRSKSAGKSGPLMMAGMRRHNVYDPDNLIMTPEEYEEFAEGCEHEEAKFAVSQSNHGPGALKIVKTAYKNGQYKIVPSFRPNSIRGNDCPWLSCTNIELGWPFINGKAAMRAMAVEHGIVYKEKKFNE